MCDMNYSGTCFSLLSIAYESHPCSHVDALCLTVVSCLSTWMEFPSAFLYHFLGNCFTSIGLLCQFSLQLFTLSIEFVMSMTGFHFLKFYLVLFQICLTFCLPTEPELRGEYVYDPQLCTLGLLFTYSNWLRRTVSNTLS